MAKSIKEEISGLSLEKMISICDEALQAILVGGQSYTIGSRNITRANLTEIKNLRAELMAELVTAQNDETLFGASLAKFNMKRN